MTATTVPVAFLSLKDAARLIGVSSEFLRRSNIPRYELPSPVPNGRPTIRYKREELMAWAEARKVGG